MRAHAGAPVPYARRIYASRTCRLARGTAIEPPRLAAGGAVRERLLTIGGPLSETFDTAIGAWLDCRGCGRVRVAAGVGDQLFPGGRAWSVAGRDGAVPIS